jgi:hypothetical protein
VGVRGDEVQLAFRFRGRVEVDVIQRDAGAVQEVLPAQFLPGVRGVGIAVPDGLVELDRVSPVGFQNWPLPVTCGFMPLANIR